MADDADQNRREVIAESPGERRARELREKAARAAEVPIAEAADLQPPVVIRDYGELMDGGSRRFLLRDKDGRTASIEWNYAIGGKYCGRVLEYRPSAKLWAPIAEDVLYRIQTWISEAILRGDYPPECADLVADYVKYGK